MMSQVIASQKILVLIAIILLIICLLMMHKMDKMQKVVGDRTRNCSQSLNIGYGFDVIDDIIDTHSPTVAFGNLDIQAREYIRKLCDSPGFLQYEYTKRQNIIKRIRDIQLIIVLNFPHWQVSFIHNYQIITLGFWDSSPMNWVCKSKGMCNFFWIYIHTICYSDHWLTYPKDEH